MLSFPLCFDALNHSICVDLKVLLLSLLCFRFFSLNNSDDLYHKKKFGRFYSGVSIYLLQSLSILTCLKNDLLKKVHEALSTCLLLHCFLFLQILNKHYFFWKAFPDHKEEASTLTSFHVSWSLIQLHWFLVCLGFCLLNGKVIGALDLVLTCTTTASTQSMQMNGGYSNFLKVKVSTLSAWCINLSISSNRRMIDVLFVLFLLEILPVILSPRVNIQVD